MTTPLTKPVRRLVKIRGIAWVVELSAAGIMFRLQGGKRRVVAPMAAVLELASQHARQDERRELARTAALGRIARGGASLLLLVATIAALASCSIGERLTGTKPKAKCVPPRVIDDTIRVTIGQPLPKEIKLGGCK